MRLEKWTERGRPPARTTWAPGLAGPGVGTQTVPHTHRQGTGGAAVLAGDPRPGAAAEAPKEVLQLAGQLVALAAVDVEHPEVAAKHLVLEAGQDRGIETRGSQSAGADSLRRLDQSQ